MKDGVGEPSVAIMRLLALGAKYFAPDRDVPWSLRHVRLDLRGKALQIEAGQLKPASSRVCPSTTQAELAVLVRAVWRLSCHLGLSGA